MNDTDIPQAQVLTAEELERADELWLVPLGNETPAERSTRYFVRRLLHTVYAWRNALQSLTPGGSEYQTPEACVAIVRETRRTQHNVAATAVMERKAAEANLSAARAETEAVRELIEFWFAPWGAYKTERWEELSGDRPYSAETMLELIRDAITKARAAGIRPAPEGCDCIECVTAMRVRGRRHASDCAVHNAPAYDVGPCTCGAMPAPEGEKGEG